MTQETGLSVEILAPYFTDTVTLVDDSVVNINPAEALLRCKALEKFCQQFAGCNPTSPMGRTFSELIFWSLQPDYEDLSKDSLPIIIENQILPSDMERYDPGAYSEYRLMFGAVLTINEQKCWEITVTNPLQNQE